MSSPRIAIGAALLVVVLGSAAVLQFRFGATLVAGLLVVAALGIVLILVAGIQR